MNDFRQACTLFSIFGVALVLYALPMMKTGDKALMPYRGSHAIHGPEDVRRAGRIVAAIGAGIAAISLTIVLFA